MSICSVIRHGQRGTLAVGVRFLQERRHPPRVPGTDMTTLGQWGADGERAGFAGVGVIDRLVHDNLEPLTALAAAHGEGWVAPLFGLSVLEEDVSAVRTAWAEAGRTGRSCRQRGR